MSDMPLASPRSFRELLAADELIVAPGAYDGITARLVEQAGFPLVYMTGAGTDAARGYPDYGLLTMTEMVENAAVLARSVRVPVLADADTGYGNELNVTRTVQEYERRGVAGIHLEDQVSPKRCGHLDGKDVVDRTRFVSLISAAVAARRSEDFVIVARTDAVAVHGLDDVAAVPQRVHGPCLLNLVPGGKTPLPDLATVADMGYRIAICPTLLLAATVRVGDAVLRELADTGRHPTSGNDTGNGNDSIGDLFARFGAAEWDAIRARPGP